MSEPALVELVVLAGVAVGLVLLGLTRAVAGQSTGARLAGTSAAVLAPAALPAALGYSAAAALVSIVVAATALGAAIIGSSQISSVVQAVIRRLGRPAVQAGLLSAAGGVLLIGALARYDEETEACLDRDLAYMNQVTWKPPLREASPTTTAAGRPVGVWEAREVRPPQDVAAAERSLLNSLGFSERVIRVGPAADQCNCHGWVFTGGRYWLNADDVENILADNGYQVVSQPRTGDVVIYRENQRITHTAVVRTAEPGGPVLVEGKWGWMGVFLHTPEGSCYGRQLTYYRGPRTTHVLAGIGGPSAPLTTTADPPAPTDLPTLNNRVGSD